MLKTQIYNLNKPEATDPIRVSDFNENAEIIDGVLATVTENLGNGGKTCRMAWGSYTGTGTYGSSNPTGITVDFYPVAVVMLAKNLSNMSLYIRDCPNVTSTWNSNTAVVTWKDNGLSWYNTESANYQNNSKNYIYYYAVFGESK